MNPTTNPAVTTYLDAVRSALSDLPADELTEVMDDVAEHLAQIDAETGIDVSTADLEARLGTPESYAAALRAAAGYPDEVKATGRAHALFRRTMRTTVTWAVRAAAAGAVLGAVVAVIGDWMWGFAAVGYSALVAAAALGLWLLVHGRDQAPAETLRALPDAAVAERGYRTAAQTSWGATFTELAVSLRTAWWIARAWIVVQLFSTALLGVRAEFPVPRFSGSVIVLLGAIVVSVWLGKRASAGGVRGWLQVGVIGTNALAILTAPILVTSMAEPAYYPDVEYVEAPVHQFAHESGEPITNIFPYGQDGRLLTWVRLYDQDGRPIDNLDWWDECGREAGMYPDGPNGNVFPRPTTDWDENGECEYRSPFGQALPGFPVSDEPVEPTIPPETDSSEPDVTGDGDPSEPEIGDPGADPTEEPDEPEPGTSDDPGADRAGSSSEDAG